MCSTGVVNSDRCGECDMPERQSHVPSHDRPAAILPSPLIPNVQVLYGSTVEQMFLYLRLYHTLTFISLSQEHSSLLSYRVIRHSLEAHNTYIKLPSAS
jgi:hypothetical protein